MKQGEFKPIRDVALGRLPDLLAEALPDHPALIYPHQTWSFSDLRGESLRVSRALSALGIGRGDRVAVWSGNIPEWIFLQFGLARLGAILVTVNTALRSQEVGYLLRHCGACAIFAAPRLRELDTRAELEKAGELPALRHRIFLEPGEWVGFLAQEVEVEYPEVGLDETINMQYTSGTTGFPKGVRLSSRNIVNNGYWLGQGLGYSPTDRLCLSVPLFHCFGCVIGVLASYTHGVTLCPVEFFEPLAVLETVERHRCTALYGVPTMFLAQLEHPQFSRFDLRCLRTGVMAGSLCPEPLMRRVMEEMHLREMTIAYGLTEASPCVTHTPRQASLERRTQTVGRVLPEVEVHIAPDGELWVRGYNVMEGYHDDGEATRKAIDGEGWLRTGDKASMDEHGYVRITGRIKDTIIRGGENIAPVEVEDRLRQHPAVVDVAVYGVSCPYYGEAVAAAVKVRCAISDADLQAFCQKALAHFKIPRQIRFVEEFPLTASGKVQKFRLREWHEMAESDGALPDDAKKAKDAR